MWRKAKHRGEHFRAVFGRMRVMAILAHHPQVYNAASLLCVPPMCGRHHASRGRDSGALLCALPTRSDRLRGNAGDARPGSLASSTYDSRRSTSRCCRALDHPPTSDIL